LESSARARDRDFVGGNDFVIQIEYAASICERFAAIRPRFDGETPPVAV
jgi:hypothetical protein